MTVDPKNLREGDRVRITLCGVFTDVDGDGDFHFRFDGGRETWLTPKSLAHAEITRLYPPIRVGDRVRSEGYPATVKAIDADMAWLHFDGGARGTDALDNLTRISEES